MPTISPEDVERFADNTAALNKFVNDAPDAANSGHDPGTLQVPDGATIKNLQRLTQEMDATSAAVTTENVTGTTYTVVAADLGKTKRTTNSSAVTVTLPNDMVQGFSALVIQAGSGQVTFQAGSGASLHNRASLTKTAGQWSIVSIIVESNADGTSASWVLAGDVGP